MVTIKIGSSQMSLSDSYEPWLADQINGRKKDGSSAVVEVDIDQGGVSLSFVAHDCPMNFGGSSRIYTPKEQAIIDLWQEKNLGGTGFALGDLMSFLKRLKHLL
jgi:hypothetical protein